MPIYSFHCTSCDKEVEDKEFCEEKQFFCVVCKMNRIHKRRVARTSFILKGDHWSNPHKEPA